MAKKYVVQTGDNLSVIAKKNNITVDELIRLNSIKNPDIIHTGDELKLTPDKVIKKVNVREDRLKEEQLNKDDLSAIQGYPHNNNYAVVDKKNRLITVYDKDNNPIYITKDFSVGASGNDYNTITYVNKNGTIISGKGNNSTPAGILEITGKSTYHGYPAYIRSRTNRDGSKENVASSLHWGNIGKYDLSITVL